MCEAEGIRILTIDVYLQVFSKKIAPVDTNAYFTLPGEH